MKGAWGMETGKGEKENNKGRNCERGKRGGGRKIERGGERRWRVGS